MMRLSCSLALLLTGIAQPALACSIFIDQRSPDDLRLQSEPVVQDASCRVINGGVHDNLVLGPATLLGNGRFQQVVGDHELSRVYVADCNTREATILLGTATDLGTTSCGPDYSHADLAGDDAMMELSVGTNLHELVDIAKSKGVIEQNPLDRFFRFSVNLGEEKHDVSAKDRFDLMCGCKLYYPDSAGATQ